MTIPRIATFVYIGDMPFSYVHSLAVLSAARVNDFDEIRLICDRVPTGPWWEQCCDAVTVEIVTPPSNVFGVPLRHPAHVADILRLHEMRSTGGVFLDLDVLCVRPLPQQWAASCVMAEQQTRHGRLGLGCAVMLCEPRSAFVDAWLTGYDPARSRWNGFRSTGRDKHWSEMSTRYPAMVADRMPDDISVLPAASFYPYNWEEEGLRSLFVDCLDLTDETLCLHLWEAVSWHPHLADLGPADIERAASTFTKAARAVFAHAHA